jgi:hypothetical protein
MIVAMATRDELKDVVKLALEGAKEFDFDGYHPPEPEQVAKYICDKWLRAPCFVLKKDEAIVGFIGLDIDSHWWSTKPIITDYRAYIMPEHRNMRAVKLLYGAVKQFADEQGVPYHAGHFVSDNRFNARRGLMRWLGFKTTGFIISYNGATK